MKFEFSKNFILSMVFLLFSSHIFCQKLIKLDSKKICSFECKQINNDFFSFENGSNKAISVINNILTKVGLKINFKIVSADIDNIAMATIYHDEKYIFYNEVLMSKIDFKTMSGWAYIFILAHEMGHHLNAHKLSDLNESRFVEELNADEFAGFALFKLGANIDEMQSAINTLRDSECTTHPRKFSRLNAAIVGWTKAKDEYDANFKTVSQTVKDLEIRVASIKKTSNSITVALKFIAINESKGIGYALKATGSGGMADYWKFVPMAEGKLIDNKGNDYSLSNVTGMGYAREETDWSVLRPGETSDAVIEFRNNHSGGQTGNIFDFYLDIWVVYAGGVGKSNKMPYSITFKGINIKDHFNTSFNKSNNNISKKEYWPTQTDKSYNTDKTYNTNKTYKTEEVSECEKANTGGYCFKNNTSKRLSIYMLNNKGERICQDLPIEIGQAHCFNNLSANYYSFYINEIQSNNSYSYFTQGQIIVKKCETITYQIK